MLKFLNKVNFFSKTVWVVNAAKWKRKTIGFYLRGYKVKYLGINEDPFRKEGVILKSKPIFLFWGRFVPEAYKKFSEYHSIDIWHMEDGFIRSVGLGASHVLPYSLCLDKKGMYYDSKSESDLELIIKQGGFSEQLIERARNCIEVIKRNGLNKYNIGAMSNADLYLSNSRKNVLVVGQVEDDQSLIFGCDKIITNADLIDIAIAENPDCNVIYKPHPDVLNGFRKEVSSIKDLEDKITIVDVNISLTEFLKKVSHLYTMTSLAGFEALFYGVKVTTIGAPFYSNWGLTDDRLKIERRGEKRSLEEVFAAAYIAYAKYINPETGKGLEIEDVLQMISENLHKKKQMDAFEDNVDKLYSFSSFHPITIEFLKRSARIKKICILTDSSKSSSVANLLASVSKKVDVLTVREKLANDKEFVSFFRANKNIEISSMHKFYNKPLGEIEKKTADLCSLFSNQLFKVMSTTSDNNIPGNVLREIGNGLKDYIYFDVLRFTASERIVKDYDAVVVLLDNVSLNKDVVKYCYFFGEKYSALQNIYFKSFESGFEQKQLFGQLKKDFAPVFEKHISHQKLKEKFSSSFWGLKMQMQPLFPTVEDFVAVCGNINDNNYAYAPASFELIDCMLKSTGKDVLYFNSGLINAKIDDDIKSNLFDRNSGRNVYVYDGGKARLKKQFEGVYFDSLFSLKDELYDFLNLNLLRFLPVVIVDGVSDRLKLFLDLYLNMVMVFLEVDDLFDRVEAFGTTMYNSFFSRVLAEIAKNKDKKTLAIQPQIISTSPRIQAPNVDFLGVIDEFQSEIFLKNGFLGNVQSIGSVNLISRLKMIETFDKGGLEKDIDVLFIMQHSASSVMFEITNYLECLLKKINLNICVKPHPHQELPVLNDIKERLDGKGCQFISKNSDTYEYVARAKVVIGYFSSVLFESAVYGKNVVTVSYTHLTLPTTPYV
jgi:capsular polysaccharide export protein